MTPKGILLTLELKDIRIEGNQVTCAIQKDAGDDPDTTTEYWFMLRCRNKKKNRESSSTEALVWEG